MTTQHFLDLRNFSSQQLEQLLTLAADMKSGKNREKYLQDKTLGLLFSVASTRTRISFQAAARQLGGHAEFLSAADLQLSNHESLLDTASVMGRYLDAIIIRMYDMSRYGEGRKSLQLFAEHAGVPIVNALDDQDHPCQVMADLLTMQEKFGAQDYKKKKVVFTWGFSERQKSLGVPHSLMTAGSLLGMNLTFCYPEGWDLDPQYVEFAKEQIEKSGGTLNFSHDLMEASQGADVIYMKNWKSLRFSKDEEQKIKQEIRADWCVSPRHFEVANPGAVYMDCLPTVRGEGVAAEVLDGPQSIVYDEAENRLHVQKAILATLVK
ncbi:ornithine carbamoyltransferase [Tumebacillus sp. ITR2]|uniref:Ornithine carbamoyltransferase n=1 Tax=Tumebacillus amylolyticus TaxID=2801339 RepID=A0ABS1JED3_9BACL|nr:ornithine carbamoyltransferase [Tumebacillus amylolyticus]MBL0388658.1 ornithine carbamoyltransferase [Tumebacillus amylolyticus]